MKAHDLSTGKEIDSKDLTDSQNLLMEKVVNLDLSELEKHKGCYFLWGHIPESNKIIVKKHLPDMAHWELLLKSLNAMLLNMSEGKVRLELKSE